MSPPNTNATTGSILRRVIHYHLDNYSYDNALFFAERLVAQDSKAPGSTYLLALCHFRLGDFHSAFEVAKTAALKGSHLGCSWIYAQSCLRLRRYREGILVLNKCRVLWHQTSNMGKHGTTIRSPFPDAPAVLCLLGKLHLGYGDTAMAGETFDAALKLNPLMWDAFTALCAMGVNVNVPNIYKLSDTITQIFDLGGVGTGTKDTSNRPITNKPDPPSRKALASGPINGNDAFSHFQASTASGAGSQSSRPPTTPETSLTSNLVTLASRGRWRDRDVSPTRRSETGEQFTRLVRPGAAQGLDGRARPHTAALGPREVVDSPLASRSEASRTFRLGRRQRGESQGLEPHRGAATAPVLVRERKRTLSTLFAQSNSSQRNELHAQQDEADAHPRDMTHPSTTSGTDLNNEVSRASSPPETRAAKRARRLALRTLGIASQRPNTSRIDRTGVSGVNEIQTETESPDPLLGSGSSNPETRPTRTTSLKYSDKNSSKTNTALKNIMNLLEVMAIGHYHLSKFDCADALKAFERLPRAHQETPWVLAQMGRTHFERAAYADAEKVFRKLKAAAPTRHQDMDLYSTVLWHLNRETDLSFLAHELIDLSWHSPQA